MSCRVCVKKKRLFIILLCVTTLNKSKEIYEINSAGGKNRKCLRSESLLSKKEFTIGYPGSVFGYVFFNEI